jgi:clan AA aspartic protease
LLLQNITNSYYNRELTTQFIADLFLINPFKTSPFAKKMGLVYADIELINAVDFENARRHIIGEDEVRRTKLTVLADSGANMMAINETIQAQLELPLQERRKVQMADSRVVEYDVVGPIHIKFANRKATCNAFVLPGDSEPLLGAIPMEEMDVLIHPSRQELIVNPEHPDYAVLKMK